MPAMKTSNWPACTPQKALKLKMLQNNYKKHSNHLPQEVSQLSVTEGLDFLQHHMTYPWMLRNVKSSMVMVKGQPAVLPMSWGCWDRQYTCDGFQGPMQHLWALEPETQNSEGPCLDDQNICFIRRQRYPVRIPDSLNQTLCPVSFGVELKKPAGGRSLG